MIIILGATSAFYVSLLLAADLTKIDINFDNFVWKYYLVIFPLVLLNIFISGTRFHFLLKQIGINLKFFDSITIYISGLSMSITPGNFGAFVKSYFLKKKLGKTISRTTPVILFEKWLEFFSVLVLIGSFLLFYDFLVSKIIFILGIILLSLSFFFMKNPYSLKYLNKLFSKIKFLKKATISIEEFHNASNELTNVKTIISMLSLTILTKFIGVLMVFLIFQSFGIQFDFFLSGQIFYTSMLIGILSFIPGGIIVTESGILGFLLNQGIPFDLSSLLVIIIRFVTLWFVTMVGFIGLKLTLKKIGGDNLNEF